MGLWRWVGFDVVMRAFMMGLVPHKRRHQRACSCSCGHREKAARVRMWSLPGRKSPHQKMNPVWYWSWTFQLPEHWENTFLLFTTSLWYFVMAAQADQGKALSHYGVGHTCKVGVFYFLFIHEKKSSLQAYILAHQHSWRWDLNSVPPAPESVLTTMMLGCLCGYVFLSLCTQTPAWSSACSRLSINAEWNQVTLIGFSFSLRELTYLVNVYLNLHLLSKFLSSPKLVFKYI